MPDQLDQYPYSHTTERTPGSSPGVYVRPEDAQDPAKEVDLLWTGARALEKEQRSPYLVTIGGFVGGIVLCGLIFFLFFNRPEIKIDDKPIVNSSINTPLPDNEVVSDAEIAGMGDELSSSPTSTAPEGTPAAQTAESGQSNPFSFLGGGSQQTAQAPAKAAVEPSMAPTQTAQARSNTPDETSVRTEQPAERTTAKSLLSRTTYTVKQGDTLGRIAMKYYGNIQPESIQRIQQANRLNNPNRLSIGQELVIPPKSY